MSRNEAEDFAQRFYARVPAHYRAYDAERGEPLLALLRVVGAQAANVHQDCEDLWDNFFIETCDDWVVPYLGALVGTILLSRPVGQSNRLDVLRTVAWRRSKGTPAMLRSLAGAISGWPTDLAEFFQMLGWSQNVNHTRLDRPLTPSLRDPHALASLGRADDPFAHAVDVRPAGPIDQARVTKNSLGIGRASWGTPGRYQIKNVGFFVRRLQTFAVKRSTPSAAPPGLPPPSGAACFSFDPLFHQAPLFVERNGQALTRAAFDVAPWETFGRDVAVRQHGVLLASEVEPQPDRSSRRTPFRFVGSGAGLTLEATSGLRLLDPRDFSLGGAHFVLSAEWWDGVGPPSVLGSLSTLLAARGRSGAFLPGTVAPGPGRLAITVRAGHSALGWPGLAPSPAARFPGGVFAVRAAPSGLPHDADGLYIYLPPQLVRPGAPVTFHVADDGSTYLAPGLDPTTLAAESQGQVYPARVSTASTAFADAFTAVHRGEGGLRVADHGRLGSTQVLIRAEIFTGAFNLTGAVSSIDQPGSSYPELDVPALWPAFDYGPSKMALQGGLPREGPRLLAIHVIPLSGQFLPSAELIVRNRGGQSLLVYLPEIPDAPAEGVRLFVADDGATYFAPSDDPGRQAVLQQRSYAGLPLARGAVGQVLPIAGVWPLQQRRPVAIDLGRWERSALLRPGELGVDPERGRFALPAGDPALGGAGLSVDYVEAFGDRVGARTFERLADASPPATRLVSQSGDADGALAETLIDAPLHKSVAEALAAAQDGDVIEIVDSATYASNVESSLDSTNVKRLALRAAPGQRPCLTSYRLGGTPASSSLRILTDLEELELNGLYLSGGPLRIDAPVARLRVIACTIDPRSATWEGSLISFDDDPNRRSSYLLCRCITAGLRVGVGVDRLAVADSIVDQQSGMAIGGLPVPSSPLTSPPTSPLVPGQAITFAPAATVQLERVTVLGGIRCDVLSASESILDELVLVEDRQAGCLRFSRFEPGSLLPRRFQCVPSEAQADECGLRARCVAPLFNSRRFGRPDYAQMASTGPPEISTASEEGSEIGAFGGARNTLRLANLRTKLREFLPVGLSAIVITET